MKRCTQVFTMPGNANAIELIENDPLCDVLKKSVVPMAQMGFIMVYMEWEDNNLDESRFATFDSMDAATKQVINARIEGNKKKKKKKNDEDDEDDAYEESSIF